MISSRERVNLAVSILRESFVFNSIHNIQARVPVENLLAIFGRSGHTAPISDISQGNGGRKSLSIDT